MANLGDVAWPSRIQSERLTLREAIASDRPGYIDLLTSQEVRQYLGGPLDRAEVEANAPEIPGAHPGAFAVELAGTFIGRVIVDRRDSKRPGHVLPGGLEIEISYALLPGWWGRGYATEAVSTALDWIAGAADESLVVLCTQTANTRSMALALRLGFSEVDRFDEFGAEQWLGMRAL